MGFFNSLNRINSRFAWSFFGFVLAAFFGGITIYSEFYRDTRPVLIFEVISSASVLDVREQLGNLDIIYDGIDLKKSKQSLRVIMLRVSNDGPDDILKTYYDANAPLGFSITCGRIIRTELVTASDPYLDRHLAVRLIHPNVATFSPVIFESQQSILLKILVIHPEADDPKIKPEGKVAKVKSLALITPDETETSPSFWSSAFSGSPAVQIVRILGYLLALIILIVGIAIPSMFFTDQINKLKRRKRAKRFKVQREKPTTDFEEALIKEYVENGEHGLNRMAHILSKSKSLSRFMKKAEGEIQKPRSPEEIEMALMVGDNRIIRIHQSKYLAEEMKRFGLVKKTDDGYSINEEMKAKLTEFLVQIESNK